MADIVHSPFAQAVTRNGKTVHVEIIEDGAGGWILEVVDEYGNSTVWDEPFPTDQAALDEVFNTIAEDRIDSLIGSPSDREETLDIDQPLTEAELNELDDFLADSADEDTSMDVSMLEGFLTSLAIGPRVVLPSEWLPWIWDKEEGEAKVDFEDLAQANRITSSIMRLYNAVVNSFMTDPASFEPIFWRAIQWGAAEWSEGFITGFQFNDEAWTLLAAGQPTWFTPFLRLGTDEGIDLTKKESDAERWMNEIEPSLVRIHAYWKEMRAKQPPDLVEDEYHNGGPEAAIQFVRGGP